MKQRDDLDQMLSAWLDDPYTPPRYLGEVLEVTRRTRQRPAWANLERWLPMAVITLRSSASPSLRLAWLMLVALVVLALAASVAVVGSQLLRGTVAIPTGDSAVFAFGSVPSYDRTGSSDIFTVRADGTDLRQLTDGPGVKLDPAWSPDGTRIAYHLGRTVGTTPGWDDLVVMDAGGRDPVTLASKMSRPPTWSCMGAWSLAWSPDGTRLVYTTHYDSCYQGQRLYVVPSDGSSPATELLAAKMDSLFPAWSPDGTQVAFLGSEAPGSWGLYLVDVGPGDIPSGGLQARRIGPGLGPGPAGGGPRWSPDGKELAVTVASKGFFVTEAEGIYIVEADGSGQRLAVERAGNPMWSPDGRRLAFARTVDPSEYWNERPCTVRMWIVDADGANERQLVPLADGCDLAAAWSPDGTRLASVLITATPEDPQVNFHLGFVFVDGDNPPVIAYDSQGGSWQPVTVPLPPAPSFTVVSPAP